MSESKVFLDTTPIIYLLDADINYGEKTSRLLSSLAAQGNHFVSSVITCTEYLVVPYRTNNHLAIDAFWEFVNDCSIDLYSVTKETSIKAAKIRAEYGFKTMDSLQLAVASLTGCSMFLTNDKQLRQYRDVKCITVEEWDE